MLGQAMFNSLELSQSEWSNQEAFILSIYGTYLKLTAAWFPKEYLQAVHSPVLERLGESWLYDLYDE